MLLLGKKEVKVIVITLIILIVLLFVIGKIVVVVIMKQLYITICDMRNRGCSFSCSNAYIAIIDDYCNNN